MESKILRRSTLIDEQQSSRTDFYGSPVLCKARTNYLPKIGNATWRFDMKSVKETKHVRSLASLVLYR